MAVATWTVRSRWAVQLCWVSWALAATSLAVAATWRELLATCTMAPWIRVTNWLKLWAISASSSLAGETGAAVDGEVAGHFANMGLQEGDPGGAA